MVDNSIPSGNFFMVHGFHTKIVDKRMKRILYICCTYTVRILYNHTDGRADGMTGEQEDGRTDEYDLLWRCEVALRKKQA